MKVLFTYVSFFLFLLYNKNVSAQNKNIDSLLSVIKIAKDDTVKTKALRNLALEYEDIDLELAEKKMQESFLLATRLNYKKGIISACLSLGYYKEIEDKHNDAFNFYNKALDLAKAEGDKTNIAGAYTRKGILHKIRGEYAEALESYNSALKIDEENGNKKYIARDYGNMGVIYWNQGDYPKALYYDFKVLKLFEELNNREGIGKTYGNIGAVYADQGNYQKALEYFLKALKLDEEVGNKDGIARNYSNIGVVYLNKKDYTNGLQYYLKALKIQEELKNKSGISISYGNIGLLYELQATEFKNNDPAGHFDSLFDKALGYYLNALKMDEELQEKKSIATKLGNIGSLYTTLKKYDFAQTYLLKALALSTELGVLELQKDHEEFLYQLFETKGDQNNAFKHYKNYTALKDSLNNNTKNKELARYELNYEFDKKQVALKAEQDKKDAVTKAESKKQKQILLLISSVLILVFIFAGFVLRSLRVTREQKKLIEIKSKETEQQKAIIEAKNKDILDSIRYAKRIQNSLLPSEKYIARNLNQKDKNE